MNVKKASLFLLSAGLLLACGKPGKAGASLRDSSLAAESTSAPDSLEVSATPVDTINLSKVPVSEKALDAFPVFNPPANITTLNKPVVRDFDRLFFPTKEGMIPLEGKVYKTFLTPVSGKEWSLAYFDKSYRDLITAAGGVLLFNGKVSQKELDRIKDEASYFGEEGSIDYPNNLVKVYAIRRKTGDHLFIQLSGNSSSGAIQILQMPEAEKK